MKNSKKGFSIVYLFFMISLVLSFGVIVLNKQSFFEKKIEYAKIEDILLKNIITAGNISIHYNSENNKNGGTYQPFLSCPGTVNFFSGASIISTGISLYESGNCVGSLPQGNFKIYYNTSKNQFLSGSLVNSGFTLTGTTTLSGTLTATTSLVFTKPTQLDTRFVKARIENNGIIFKNTGDNYVFWTNSKMKKYIESNTNNTGGLSLISDVPSGSIYFDITGSFSGKIIEFNKNLYESEGKLLKISEISFSSPSGIIGYLQQDGSFSGSLSNAQKFDFKHKDYAVFISYSQGLLDNIRYKLKIYDHQTANFSYINPIKDDGVGIEYMGSNIVINNGQFFSKIYNMRDDK